MPAAEHDVGWMRSPRTRQPHFRVAQGRGTGRLLSQMGGHGMDDDRQRAQRRGEVECVDGAAAGIFRQPRHEGEPRPGAHGRPEGEGAGNLDRAPKRPHEAHADRVRRAGRAFREVREKEQQRDDAAAAFPFPRDPQLPAHRTPRSPGLSPGLRGVWIDFFRESQPALIAWRAGALEFSPACPI